MGPDTLIKRSVECVMKTNLYTNTIINNLKSSLSGQETRLIWIEKYLFEKTPKELSLEQIESALGHKVILK